MDYAKWAAKAIFAGAVAGVTAAAGVIDGGITAAEWLFIAGAALVAAGGTFGITNGPDPR